MRAARRQLLPALAWIAGVTSTHAQAISGRVTDLLHGEPLRGIEVRCAEHPTITSTRDDGRFELDATLPCTLRVNAVGYRPVTHAVTSSAPVDIVLAPESLAGPRQSVTVGAGRFPGEESSVALVGTELRNLSTVLIDDPLRAVHALPGAVAVDDFQSQFSLRGAGFSRIGLLVDGVLMHAPFHTVQADPTGASTASFQGEILESVSLLPGPLPSRYGDRTAGVLELRTRDGLPVTRATQESRRVSGKVNVSTVSAAASAEGRLGRKGAWLATARQSYLNYIIQRTSDDPGLGFAFRDAQAKVSYDLTSSQRASLLVMVGRSGLERDPVLSNLGLNSIATSRYNTATAIATWRFAHGSDWIASARAAYLRERYGNDNRFSTPLQDGYYTEWVGSGEASRQWNPRTLTEFGGSVRRIREDGRQVRLRVPPLSALPIENWRGSGVRWGAFALQNWNLGSRVHLEAGIRADGHGLAGSSSATPYGALSIGGWTGARLSLSWAQAAQFAEVSQLTSTHGRLSLVAARSSQVQLGITQAIGESMRLRVEAYNRQDRDLLARPLFNPRVEGSVIYQGSLTAPWENSQRAFARGVQMFLQRRSANRLGGWISYTYGRARTRDGILRTAFDSDFELRHLAQVVGLYRLRSRWNLSGRFTYGSGMPIAAFLELRNGVTYLSGRKNLLRLPSYQRTDLRVNRAFVTGRVQWTLFAEVLNVTNHANIRFDDLRGFDARTGIARVALEKTFPVVPSGGLVVDF